MSCTMLGRRCNSDDVADVDCMHSWCWLASSHVCLVERCFIMPTRSLVARRHLRSRQFCARSPPAVLPCARITARHPLRFWENGAISTLFLPVSIPSVIGPYSCMKCYVNMCLHCRWLEWFDSPYNHRLQKISEQIPSRRLASKMSQSVPPCNCSRTWPVLTLPLNSLYFHSAADRQHIPYQFCF